MNNNPFEFRAGSAGFGLFVGCGAGVGVLTPVSLHSIPVIGQIAGSVAASLRQLDSTFGGIGWRITSAINSRAKPLGLRAGTGCGVAIGYGWGAGVMLKPTAMASLSELLKSKIPPSLAGKLQGANNSLANSKSSVENGAELSTTVVSAEAAVAAPTMPLPPSPSPQSSSAELEKEVATLTKIVLQQQLELQKVNEKVLELSQQTKKKR